MIESPATLPRTLDDGPATDGAPPIDALPTATPDRERIGATRLALPALVGVALVMRLWELGRNRFGFDESFTSMAGRMPLGTMLSYLRARDSHPPLDYLLRAPLARLGTSEFVMRLPSVACSVLAVALFAWWMRRWGIAGVVATALLAINTFQVVHGRDVRMYADLELIGVATVVLADSWIRNPRSWHAAAVGGLVFVGLLTHVQMFLLAAGLVALAGIRTDRAAWHWRAGIAGGVFGWAVLWGRSFLAQSRGGHSDWIPRTTLAGIVHTVGSLVTNDVAFHALAVAGVVVGAVFLARTDRKLGRVWVCCGLVPVALAALGGLVAPVLLDRTLTVVSWAPLLALGFLVGGLAERSRLVAVALVAGLVLVMLPTTVQAVTTRSTPDMVLRHIQQVAQPGDVVAIFPAGRMHEVVWTVGVRGSTPYHDVPTTGIPDTRGLLLGSNRLTGRLWLLHWSHRRLEIPAWPQCAPKWRGPGATVQCLMPPPGALHVDPGPYSWAKAAPQ
jgi:Dolichyl-phosphate-mannose-protein mannosyltransferase